MPTDPDALFQDTAPSNPDNQPLPVEHPDFRVRVADYPLPWHSDELPDPEWMTPVALLTAYVDLKRMADAFSLASTEVSKGADILAPYVEDIIAARKGLAIPAIIGVTPYLIARETKKSLKLDGEKQEIIETLANSKLEHWSNAVEAKPDYNHATLMKRVRQELKDNGIKGPASWTAEGVSAALPPDIGQFIRVETTTALTFKEQK